MDLQSEKIHLAQLLLETQNPMIIEKIREVFESQSVLSKAQLLELDLRRERHFDGNSKSFSWSEAKSIVQSNK